MQEAYLRLWKRRESIDLTQNVPSYLCHTGHNLAVDRSRSARYKHERADPDTMDEHGRTALDKAVEPASVEDQAIAGAEVELVAGVLSEITETLRDVLVLSALGYTQPEIAEMTDAPLGTVKTRHRLGREQLQQRFSPAAD